MGKNKNDRILVISDMHIPYHHPQLVPFLKAVKEKYKPTRVVCIGDEVDKHAMSFHDSDPDLMSAGDELAASIKCLQPLYKMFPNVDLVDSNHGSMHYRKGKHHGIPRKYLSSYGDILEAPKGWKWHDELILKSNSVEIMFRHQFKKNPLVCSQQMAMCVVQGHFHEDFNIQYVSSPNKLLWAMTVGCLIDKKALAFEYNKTNHKRPIIGVAMIIDGQPLLIPMLLNKNGKWTKKI
jgi:predicted phosphodiesterase